MEPLLRVQNLQKSYFTKKVLKGINIQVEEGKIVGLLGPNGSGKTTLLKIIAGLLKPSSGDVYIEDYKPGLNTKLLVSYLPDVNFLYKWMRVKDAMEFYKDFYNDFNTEKCRELLKFMKLNLNDKVDSLSKGMQEKLNLTLVLSRKARLYLLDEPLGGIDPVSRDQIIDAILNNYREDSAMIISTHLVRDIERLFDEVAFINEGNIVMYGHAEELRMQNGKSIDELYKEVFGNV